MQKKVRESKLIRAGNSARISVKLKRGATSARVFIYSQYNQIGDFCPHVRNPELIPSSDGKPVMQTPAMVSLHRYGTTQHVFEFFADEDIKFQVLQGLDAGEEITIKAKVESYGKIAQKIRWIYGRCRRKLRSFSASFFGLHGGR